MRADAKGKRIPGALSGSGNVRPSSSSLASMRTVFLLASTLIQLLQEHDTLLLVRIGSCNERNARFRLAEIDGEMRCPCRDIHEVPGTRLQIFLQFLAIPHARVTAQNINSRLMVGMQMCMSLA